MDDSYANNRSEEYNIFQSLENKAKKLLYKMIF